MLSLRVARQLAAVLVVIGALFVSRAWAQGEEPPVLFAGFAFSGDYANRDRLYPHSAALSAEDRSEYLDRLLRTRLQQRPELARRFSLELSDGQRDVSSVAFALVQEQVEKQRVDGKWLVIVTLQANVLAFNRASRTLVASYPVRMRFTRARDTEPAEGDVRQYVREAYTSPNAGDNIFEAWLARLQSVKFRQGARKYLRVTGIKFTAEAQGVMAGAGASAGALGNQVANLLEGAIAERNGVSLVPNSVGEAIGNKMAYRFANGAELQLSLPEPDYAITFTVREFVSRKIERPEAFQDVFRVKGNVAITQPDSARTVMDENVYDTLIVTRPKRANVQVDDWSQYAKTLQGLLFGVARAMSVVDDGWLKENASRGLDARQGFINAREVLKDSM